MKQNSLSACILSVAIIAALWQATFPMSALILPLLHEAAGVPNFGASPPNRLTGIPSVDPGWLAAVQQDIGRSEGNLVTASGGLSVATAGDVNGDGFSDVIVGAPNYDNGQLGEGRAYVYYGAATGLSPNAAWTAESNQVEAHFGSSVGTAGDVNGDGFSDVIIGVPNLMENQTRISGAYIYLGSASGLGATAASSVKADEPNNCLGYAVGTAGDVDGDGYDDVIVGAPNLWLGTTSTGRAYVYRGSASGIEGEPAWTGVGPLGLASYGISVGTAGDLNADGYSDVIVGAPAFYSGSSDGSRVYIYLGSQTGLRTVPAFVVVSSTAFANFGSVVGTAGDVNGDGYSDVIIGAPYSSPSDPFKEMAGKVIVYHGAATGLTTSAAWTAEGDERCARFGFAAGTAGDVNDDGYDDVIIGAPGDTSCFMNDSRTYVYRGSASGLRSTAWMEEVGGFSVGTAGDVNGDGNSDVVAGAASPNGLNSEPQPFVYYSINHAPVASAGTDQVVRPLTLVILDGSASYDADGDVPLAYTWRQDGGPPVTLRDAARSTASFTTPETSAVLTFTLTVTDTQGLPSLAPGTVMITVNQPHIFLPYACD